MEGQAMKPDAYVSLLIRKKLGTSIHGYPQKLEGDVQEVQQLADAGDYKGALIALLCYVGEIGDLESELSSLKDDYKSLEEDYSSLENEKDQADDERGEAVDIANKVVDLLKEYLELDVKNVVGHSKEYDKAVNLRRKIEDFMDNEGERLTDL